MTKKGFGAAYCAYFAVICYWAAYYCLLNAFLAYWAAYYMFTGNWAAYPAYSVGTARALPILPTTCSLAGIELGSSSSRGKCTNHFS